MLVNRLNKTCIVGSSRLFGRSKVVSRSFAAIPEDTSDGEPLSAADVIYRNPESIANRLELFHLLRLQQQSKLDKSVLEEMAKMRGIERRYKDCVRMTTKWSANEPGCEKQFCPSDGEVTLTIPIKILSLNADELQLLRRLTSDRLKFNKTGALLELTVGDFPFSEQNKKRAFEIVRDLVREAKNAAELNPRLLEEEGEEKEKEYDGSKVIKRRLSRSKPSLEFPKSWLNSIPKREVEA